jgi:glycosyltransferase involved in cell wall biosynthesis
MIFLSFRFPHHGVYSSYHRLLHYLGEEDEAVDASMPAWMYQKLFNPRGWTQAAWRAHKERKAYTLARTERHEWLHYLYPEQGYLNGHNLRAGGLKIAMSCHLPREIIEASKNSGSTFQKGLAIADALIVMSPNDVECYQNLAPNAKVAFIPHGIDIHHFKPSDSDCLPCPDHISILTCGGMLRDFETLAKVIEIAASRRVPWRFTVITSKALLDQLHRQLSASARHHFEPLHGLTDAELLKSYQRADLLYLPLINATANNAVLEAMACGLPLLLSDFPATRAYAADTASYVTGRDPEEAFAQLEKLVGCSDSLRRKSKEVRKRAESHLAWEFIFDQQMKFLRGD